MTKKTKTKTEQKAKVYQGDIQKKFMKAKKKVFESEVLKINREMTKDMPKGRIVTAKTTKPYSVILKMNDTKYKAKGETILEAIESLEVTQFKTAGILIVKKGEKIFERKFGSIFQLKRLFNNEIFRVITAKNISYMLN